MATFNLVNPDAQTFIAVVSNPAIRYFELFSNKFDISMINNYVDVL